MTLWTGASDDGRTCVSVEPDLIARCCPRESERPWRTVCPTARRYENVEKKHVRYGERLSGQATTEEDGGAAIATTGWGR